MRPTLRAPATRGHANMNIHAPAPEVRRSRQVVAFDPSGNGWNVHASADENSLPLTPNRAHRQFSAAVAPSAPAAPPPEPELIRSRSPQRPLPPPKAPAVVRRPLTDVNVDCHLLRCELHKVEHENTILKRRNVILEKTVRGLCTLYREPKT